MSEQQIPTGGVTRRNFLASSAAAATFVATVGAKHAMAQADDRLRVGLVGCGGRGTGAANDCLNADPGTTIVALGDLFEDRLNGCRQSLLDNRGDRVDLPSERCFSGWDNFQRVIDSGVDYVILATPPGFRPQHFEAAVQAGKHVFMEKPVAVDGPGIRTMLAASDVANDKGLGVVAGTQRRHQLPYVETMQRIHDGAIGRVLGGSCYWNQGGLWSHEPRPEWSDMEWQIRNWLYFTWLSGDHIVEQHVHNLDVMNWAIGEHPAKAYGMGGRQVRTEPRFGHIYDHFAIEYEYPGGARVLSMCRQQDGTAGRVGEHIVGTEGASNGGGGIWGANPYRFREENPPNPYEQEHVDLITSIRAGQPLNEGRQVSESTLSAIMGRMSAYTGQEVSWDKALNSEQRWGPDELVFGPLPVPPVPEPGKTPLV